MGKYDKYKSRMNRNGKNTGEAYANNTIAFIESTFASSPTFRVLDVLSTEFPNIKQMDARVVEVERLGTLREVLFRPGQGLNVGTYIKFDGDTWIIFDMWGNKETGLKVMVEKCNRTIKWKHDGNIREYDCLASATPLGSKANQSKMDVEWNKYDVSLPLGQMYCFVEKNNRTNEIKMNQRFIFGSSVYEVVGIDDTTSVDKNGFGILQMTLKVTTKRSEDDFANRIADDTVDEPTPTTPPDEGGIW
ncbi:hypothetical protein AB3N02_22530 [Priestia aryabhattai]|uniref:hypothetical protein n=1 Tax=Priestia aryabhattai TaxID=412384 RepID=UPI0039A36A63